VEPEISIAGLLGFNVSAAWHLFWLLFFVRLFLGLAVGFDEVTLSLRRIRPSTHESEKRSLRIGNSVVTALNVVLLVMFVLLWK